MAALIGLVVHSCVCQLVYIRFLKKHQIQDVETFFKAARSERGAFKLFRLQKVRGFASLAAVVLLCRHIIATNVQQAITEQGVLKSASNGTVPVCSRLSTPSANASSSFINFDDASIGAVWGGFTGKGGDVVTIIADCPGKVCRWDNYTTIAVTHHCDDISLEVVKHCQEGSTSNCNFTIPSSDLTVSWPIEGYKAQGLLNDTYFADTPWYFSVFEAMAVSRDGKNDTAVAQRCILYPEAQRLSGESVDGEFTEKLLSRWHNTTQPFADNPEWLMDAGGDSDLLSINGKAAVAYQRWFFNWFTGAGNASFEGFDFAGKDQHQVMNSSLFAHSVDERIKNVALALSKTIRSTKPSDTLYDSATPPQTVVTGRAFKEEQHIQILWNWLIPTAILGLLITVVLIATVAVTHKKIVGIHKGNILALLNWGPPDESRIFMMATRGSSNLRRVRDAEYQSVHIDHNMRLQYRG